MNLQQKLINVMYESYVKFPDPRFEDLGTLPLDTLCHLYFLSYRVLSPRGLRLTPRGLVVFKNYFQCWELVLRDYRVHNRHLIFFENISRYPWFLDNKLFVTFDDDLMFKAKLSGDIETLIHSFYSELS